MKPDGRNIRTKVLALYNEENEPVESCPHARQTLYAALSDKPEAYDLMRVENVRNA